MSHDLTERLAREAGIETGLFNMGGGSLVFTEGCHGVARAEFERFAQLVAQECARVCEQHAADHEESARDESDERFAVYAKHERRCAAAIKARFGIKE